jgi:hypothetical protein
MSLPVDRTKSDTARVEVSHIISELMGRAIQRSSEDDGLKV